MFTEGPQFLQGGVKVGYSIAQLQIYKEDVFAQLPFGGARFDPAHVQPPPGKTTQGLQQGPRLVGMQGEGQAGQRSL